MSKVVSIFEAMNLVSDGTILAIGGNVLHRSPMAIIRQIVRENKKNLRIVKTAGAHDVDLLVRGGCVDTVDAGFVSYETVYGLAPYFREACQNGRIKMNEHACYTVMSALNAGRINVPFMPVYGLVNSDLIDCNDYFSRVIDPFTGESVTVVKAIVPDLAILHVSACDVSGNCIIDGANFDDILMAKASRRVLVSTEKIISSHQIELNFEKVVIPSLLVDHIVIKPKGALPCDHGKIYGIDSKIIEQFLEDSTDEGLESYLKHYALIDHFEAKVHL